jgi:hypothetical protein
LAGLGPGKAFVVLGRKHHHSGSAMLGYALRTALAGKTEEFTKTRFGLLKLPILLDWLRVPIEGAGGRAFLGFAHGGACF